MGYAIRFRARDLDARASALVRKGFPVSQWIRFCRAMLEAGLVPFVDEAKTTRSKYITVRRSNNKKGPGFRVRFSDHKARRNFETEGRCDLYVGMGNLGTITTDEAIERTLSHFQKGSVETEVDLIED